ncbi:ribbon-helix-helix protein, CopG family [Nocardia amikacinitolerans]|uniref:ribbon-helix-helix protein, CopG family n=1 Tax=Nocardia amikacinitolerans TaxID=756689 RepID=UPI0020A51A0F|nr:ribbon-helix-helix protein, CopG family [Nocardia amikacinitolerans]MCP2289339.1 Ribbon-helix-helix protein, copG family [Nocardia amikacinitolerans]
MKLSVSLSEDDVAVLDAEVCRSGLPGRSAAIHKAIDLLRSRSLEDAYEAAWDEWDASDEDDVWSIATGDGLA